jgi:hypothetical protein
MITKFKMGDRVRLKPEFRDGYLPWLRNIRGAVTGTDVFAGIADVDVRLDNGQDWTFLADDLERTAEPEGSQ